MADEKDDTKSGGNGDAKDKAGKNTDAKTGKNSQQKDDKTNNQGGGDKDGGDKSTGKSFTQDELDAIVERRLKRERAKDKENAELSETERLKKENEENKKELQESRAKDNFVVKLDIKHGDALKIFKYYRDEIEFDDKGKVANFDDIVKMAKEDFPQFFPANVQGKGDGGGGSGGGDKGAGAGDMNSMIRARSGR